MRFLALQTNIGEMKKQFIPEGENEIMTVTRHPIRFMLDFLLYTAVASVIAVALASGILLWEDMTGVMVFTALFGVLGVVYFLLVSKSYIAYRYNFLIITSEKLVIITHRSFVQQQMDSIPLDSIQTTTFHTQFFGIVRCGLLEIHLTELAAGKTREIVLEYIPYPDTVASAIENASAMQKQTKQGTEGQQLQELKAQNIKEELILQTGQSPTAAPSEVQPIEPEPAA